MTYKTEFPDYQSEIPAVFLTAPWTDHSYHNDACPSFARSFGDREVHVFVDEADPAKRFESGPDYPRFSVFTTDSEGCIDDEPSYATDSLVMLLDHVGFIVGEVSR